MITALVKILLPEPMHLKKAQDVYNKTAPTYLEVPGLIRKYYLLAEDGSTAGGVYLWENREAAEAMYNRDWYAFIREKYGVDPEVTYFESPVIVDNEAEKIITG